MKGKAAKYFWHDGRRSPYFVVVYTNTDPETQPHDYELMFTPKQWKATGCRVSKKNEVIDIEITINEVVQ